MSGFETGDLREWPLSSGISNLTLDTTQVTKGGWSLKVPLNDKFDYLGSPAGLNLATGYVRANVYTNTSNPSVSSTSLLSLIGSAAIGSVRLATSGGPTVALRLWNEVTGTQVGSDYVTTANAWHTVELKCVVGSGSGVLEMRVDGVVRATGASLNTGSVNIDHLLVGMLGASGSGQSGYAWLDDVVIRRDQYPGAGYIIARQGAAGTPSYDGWSKAGSSTAWQDWSHATYNAASYCYNNALAAQTMVLASFASTYTAADGTKYGSGTLGAGDSNNAGKTAILAQGYGTVGLKIRRRVGGANTDTTVTVSGSLKYFDDGVWSPSYANLTDGTTEIGAVQNANGTTELVYDAWVMIDYSPATPETPLPHVSNKLTTRRMGRP